MYRASTCRPGSRASARSQQLAQPPPDTDRVAAALGRARGFALENADFEIFQLAKCLICNVRGLRFRSKTAVVKTYPIPKLGWFRIDSSHHVSATHRAQEERQDAPLLERGREQAPWGRAGGAAARFVSRRDQLLAGGRMAQGDRGFRRGCRP